MAKTPEEVIAKLQRRLQNTSDHMVGLLDSHAGWKKKTKELEDTLAWIHRQPPDQPVASVFNVIEQTIPQRLKKEAQHDDDPQEGTGPNP